MKTIYFVRHGESEGNVQKVHQTSDNPLSEIGRAQAKMVAHRFEHIAIDRLISSPYRRAQQTAAAISAVKNIAIDTNPLLGERRGPSQLIGLPHHSQLSLETRAHITTHRFEDDGNWQHSDEETARAFVDRAQAVLDWLSSQPQQRLAVTTHSLLLHMIVVNILSPQASLAAKYDTFERFVIHNTSLTIAEYDAETHNWRLVSLNDHAHL